MHPWYREGKAGMRWSVTPPVSWADIPRKTAADLGRGVAGTNGQRLQEFLTNTEWDYREMDRLRMQYMVAQASLGRGLQIIDDTGFAKKGTHSVGVARQYSGTLGRVDNCQVLVTSHYVDGSFDWPIAARLYLTGRLDPGPGTA